MLEITICFLVGTVLFYVLSIIFRISELNFMTLIVSICTVASVLQDTTIPDTDLVLYIVPLVYAGVMSLIRMIYARDD